MTKFLCLDTKSGILGRYVAGKRVDRVKLPEDEPVSPHLLAALEHFRANGRVKQGPKTA